MKLNSFKIIGLVLGLGLIGSSFAISISSCSENGLSPKIISQILSVYQQEAYSSTETDSHIVNVGNIGEFAKYSPSGDDIQYWNDIESPKYKNVVSADAQDWEEQITAPLKTYINNNIKEHKSLIGTDDPQIQAIAGFDQFREDYFSVHLVNLYAAFPNQSPDQGWVFEDSASSAIGADPVDHEPYKIFKCLQSDADNQAFQKNSSYPGTPYEIKNNQTPSYILNNKEYCNYLDPRFLFSDKVFDQTSRDPVIAPFIESTNSIVRISYLVKFSPKPYTKEAPPIAFYVHANLRCDGIS
ncbi:MAG: hypothetical protein LBP70_03755 [Mycoplasmataceae bacterium]|nr:hypothetical protein [Mycoplasmataceae bacterium]